MSNIEDKVKIQILSDLHLEREYYSPIIDPETEVLILSGNIHNGRGALDWLYKLSKKDIIIIYIFGAHEFCSHNISDVKSFWKTLQSSSHQLPDLYILDNSCIVYKHIKFVGTTLWTLEEIEDLWIQTDTGLLTSENLIIYHENDVNFLKKELTKSNRNVLKTVVITSYPPTLDILQKYKLDLWIHGKTPINPYAEHSINNSRTHKEFKDLVIIEL